MYGHTAGDRGKGVGASSDSKVDDFCKTGAARISGDEEIKAAEACRQQGTMVYDSNDSKSHTYKQWGGTRCFVSANGKVVPSAAGCKKVTARINSPISLAWEGAGNEQSFTATQFSLIPGTLNKWFQWKASAQFPLLVYTPNGQTEVDAEHLFGNYTFGQKWNNGYEALLKLDSNGDMILSGRELEAISLWFDANRNGQLDDGELKSAKSVALTKVFARFDRCSLDTHDIIADLGYEREANGKTVTGKSIDWFAEGPFDTRQEAIVGLKRNMALNSLNNKDKCLQQAVQ